jgi:hypothetical protein
MAFRTVGVTVTDTPVLLVEAVAGDLEIWVNIDQSADWYIGGPDVSTGSGYHRFGRDLEFHSEVRPGDQLYGIVPSGFVLANVIIRSA